MESDSVLRNLEAAVEAAPDDVPLRLLLAELLAEAGERDEAVRHAATVLQGEPSNAAALSVIASGLLAREGARKRADELADGGGAVRGGPDEA